MPEDIEDIILRLASANYELGYADAHKKGNVDVLNAARASWHQKLLDKIEEISSSSDLERFKKALMLIASKEHMTLTECAALPLNFDIAKQALGGK